MPCTCAAVSGLQKIYNSAPELAVVSTASWVSCINTPYFPSQLLILSRADTVF